MVNGSGRVFIERDGRVEAVPNVILSERHRRIALALESSHDAEPRATQAPALCFVNALGSHLQTV